LDKERENAVALQVLPDLLAEMDGLPPRERLLSLVQGILAANIFDWGARACVELYTNGTILDIYRCCVLCSVCLRAVLCVPCSVCRALCACVPCAVPGRFCFCS